MRTPALGTHTHTRAQAQDKRGRHKGTSTSTRQAQDTTTSTRTRHAQDTTTSTRTRHNTTRQAQDTTRQDEQDHINKPIPTHHTSSTPCHHHATSLPVTTTTRIICTCGRAAAEDAGAILPTNYCFLFANMRNFQSFSITKTAGKETRSTHMCYKTHVLQDTCATRHMS